MIGIILAGGYAKRLWPLTLDTPKPLLLVRGRPIIDYALDEVSSSSIITSIIVLTNSRFHPKFKAWAEGKRGRNIEVLSDGSSTEEGKPGAIGALVSIALHIRDDFLVIAGDCIYPRELRGLLQYFGEKKAPVVGVYRAKDVDQVRRGSAVELASDNTIVGFLEKPENATGLLVGAVAYAFPESIRDRLKEYSNLGLSRDEPGRFIEWLHKRETVYGYLLDGVVWDIGTLQAYEKTLASLPGDFGTRPEDDVPLPY
jgi:glucose-1-phosphate thymidylyltransferase